MRRSRASMRGVLVLALAAAMAVLPARASFDTVFYGLIDASLVSARAAPADGVPDAEPWNLAGPSRREGHRLAA